MKYSVKRLSVNNLTRLDYTAPPFCNKPPVYCEVVMEPSSSKSEHQKGNKPGPFARLKRLLTPESLDELRLSNPPVLDRKADPSVTTLISRDGARTCLSIERVQNPPFSVKEETRFCAVHNTADGARHTLRYSFQESIGGDITITGDISELGAQSVVPNVAVCFVNTMILEFGLNASSDSTRQLVRLRQAAFHLAECFTDDGYEGVERYLKDNQALPKGDRDWLLYGKRLQQDSIDNADGEQRGDALVDPKGRNALTSEELAILTRVCEALEAIETLSLEQYEFLRNQEVELGMRGDVGSFLSDEHLDEPRWKLTGFSEVSKKIPFGRRWVSFVTPEVPRNASVIFSLQLPFAGAPESDDLRGLLIEVQGPKMLGLFRETFRMVDIDNTMGISHYGNNAEFFRNLFRELHAVNRSDLENESKIIHVLDLLYAYGIEMKPYGVFTRLNHMRRTMWFFVMNQVDRLFQSV